MVAIHRALENSNNTRIVHIMTFWLVVGGYKRVWVTCPPLQRADWVDFSFVAFGGK